MRVLCPDTPPQTQHGQHFVPTVFFVAHSLLSYHILCYLATFFPTVSSKKTLKGLEHHNPIGRDPRAAEHHQPHEAATTPSGVALFQWSAQEIQ